MDELKMIDILVNQDWLNVSATVLYETTENRYLLNLKIETYNEAIILAGEAHVDKDGYDNSSSLTILKPNNQHKYNIDSTAKSSLKAVNFNELWSGTPFESLLKAPRDITFKHDPFMYVREFSCETFLDYFSSLQLSKQTDNEKAIKFIISAPIDAPCCVEAETFYE